MDLIGDYVSNAGECDQDDDDMWQDDNIEAPGSSNDGFSNYGYNNQGGPNIGYGQGGYGHPRFSGPHGPQGQTGHYPWGRGFGPAGPPTQQRYTKDRDRHLRYLMRCGIPKESLMGLPKVLLRLMEPHYCGVCGIGSVNVSESRLHYVSKNHAKNQKKWLSQNAEVGPHRPREIPLKSRDLYCELCDVHITSKTHADSHYAGKPHRAVVDGRKNPKNPYLVQKGMKNRVEQLIRREKKHLKFIDSAEVVAEKEKETKPVPPELYCDICKASVTCTEQMTMHLNGKRHLAKEKQHILKMMKGGPPDNKDKSTDSGDANKATDIDDGAGDANDQIKQDDDVAVAEDDCDWSNGDGNWDDDPL